MLMRCAQRQHLVACMPAARACLLKHASGLCFSCHCPACLVPGLQKIKKLIDEKYRINLVLDNLPVTAQDLLDEVSHHSSQQPTALQLPD